MKPGLLELGYAAVAAWCAPWPLRRLTVHGISAAAVVLDAAQPAAYCVPGGPATVVLTSAALP